MKIEHIEDLIMQNRKCPVVVVSLLLMIAMSFSCRGKQEKTDEPEISKNMTKLIYCGFCSYEVINDDFIFSDPKDLSYFDFPEYIRIKANLHEYSSVKRWEKEALAPQFSDFVKNEEDLSYAKVKNFYCESKGDDFKLLSNYPGYNAEENETYFLEGTRQDIYIDGEPVGEYAVTIYDSDSLVYICYEGMILSESGLIKVDIELRTSGFRIQIPNPNYFDYEDSQLVWKSEKDKKEFYDKMESDEYKKLPSHVVLLRETKDLFLKTLVTTD